MENMQPSIIPVSIATGMKKSKQKQKHVFISGTIIELLNAQHTPGNSKQMIADMMNGSSNSKVWAETSTEKRPIYLSIQNLSEIRYQMEDYLEEEHKNRNRCVRTPINFSNYLPPELFKTTHPNNHCRYLSETTRSFCEVTPLKISWLQSQSNPIQTLKFEFPDYFSTEIEPQLKVLHHCTPGSKKLYYYNLDDIEKSKNITCQFLNEIQLPISWTFGNYIKTTITPDGSIYAINCRTSENKLDPSLYKISMKKVSVKAKLPSPRRECSLIYFKNFLFVIGGVEYEKQGSTSCFKYSLKSKKWVSMSSSHVGTRNPTLCTFNDRYILKIGGLNEYSFIDKSIQLYDTLNDRWSIIKTMLKDNLDQAPILFGSSAVQINEKQVLIMGGKNNNGFAADSTILLEITKIRERIKEDAKVEGLVWSLDLNKQTILSFSGNYSTSNVITQKNSLYLLRSSFGLSPPN